MNQKDFRSALARCLLYAIVLSFLALAVAAERRPDPSCRKGFVFEYGFNTCICCVPESCPPPMGYTYTGSACRCPDESWTACFDEEAGKYTVCVPPGETCPEVLAKDKSYKTECIERRTTCLSLCTDGTTQKDCAKDCPTAESCKKSEKEQLENMQEITVEDLCSKLREHAEKRGAWKCPQGFKKDDNTKTCAFAGLRGRLTLDSDTDSVVRDLADTLRRGDGRVVEGKDIRGNAVKFGMIKTTDGDVLFTSDGKKYRDSLTEVLRPGLGVKAGNAWNALTNVPAAVWNWAFHTKFKDDYPGEDKELKWQVSADGIKDFYTDLANPETVCDTIKDAAEKGKKIAEVIDDAREVGKVKAVLNALGSDDPFTELATIPAKSVIQLGDELNKDNWAEGARIYMRLRAEGKDPGSIVQDPPAELEFSIGWGTESLVGREMLYKKYEEMYQRYLIAKALGRKD